MVITIKYLPFDHVIVNFLHKLMNQERFFGKMDTNALRRQKSRNPVEHSKVLHRVSSFIPIHASSADAT